MARTERQAQAKPAEPLGNEPPFAGRCCGYCGVKLPGTTATLCIHCLRDNTAACRACLNAKGKLKPAFILHYWNVVGAAYVEGGKPKTEAWRKCVVCGVDHDGRRHKLDCAKCKNQRYVLKEKRVSSAEHVGSVE